MPSGLLRPLRRQVGALFEKARLSIWPFHRLLLHCPRLGLRLLQCSSSSAGTLHLWASMMASGTSSNLWPQCLAALQSWLTFPKNKNIDHCKGSATHHRLVLVAFMGPGTLVCLTIQHKQQSEEQTRALGTGWDGCCVEGAWCYTLRSACVDDNPATRCNKPLHAAESGFVSCQLLHHF